MKRTDGAGRQSKPPSAEVKVTDSPAAPASLRWRAPVGVLFITTGILHFTSPEAFEAIIPPVLPAPRALVFASGIAELAGGIGILNRRWAKRAGWWLIATLVTIFPANVGMALAAERFPQFPEWALWARLPLQALLIALVWQAAGRPRRF